MSYATRLVAMSRGSVPNVVARDTAGQTPGEEVVEVDAPAPEPASPAVAAAPQVHANVAESASVSPATTAPRREPPPPPAPPPNETIVERHTIVEAARPRPAVVLPTQSVSVLHDPAALPLQAQWLAEPAIAEDPLVASAETDALRELMRSVRQWTSSPPTVIEHPDEPPAAASSAAAVAVPPAQTQVSIGNVTVTVEDAPVASKRAPAEPRTKTDRMARNHIRGG